MPKIFNGFIDIERLIHSLKSVIAVLIGIFLIYMIGIYADLWILITIIVVMCAQIYVGGVLQKSYFRFLGTFLGCLIAVLAITTVGVNFVTVILTTGLSVFIFSYLATGNENLTNTATLGAVTTAIIMVQQNPSLTLAAHRFFEISVGIFIAAVVSQFILPIHASTHLRRTQAKTLAQLKDYYKMTIMTKPNDTNLDYQELEENIVKSLLKQRRLAKESVTEPFKPSFNPIHFMRSLYCEREIFHAMTFMHTALVHVKNKELLLNSPFHASIIQAFDNLIKKIESKTRAKDHLYIPSFDSLQDELKEETKDMTQEELLYINGYLFSAEIILNSLTKLAKLYEEG